ncbi:MAG: hypothetical protein COW84_00130 [Gammaproteobacteria bacterium CG22_combo_CG10-13_8_21_14_all_40_8]|nr:MAG: hypothetical protein COW84_00130 [Gammaproteobacteria bacterium CG22_combo_CG10-13_8_21_14_all_40_8]
MKLTHVDDRLKQRCSGIMPNDKKLLLIKTSDNFIFIENKCGHLGILLTDAKIESDVITCMGHCVAFCLKNDEVKNCL